mmetsp:Transcript_64395/g.170576  ORF Transcript_64395/g.170576 Transcript_64395/m.170576 type:complete len:248 (+) Transcript_64395:450-1193(+)
MWQSSRLTLSPASSSSRKENLRELRRIWQREKKLHLLKKNKPQQHEEGLPRNRCEKHLATPTSIRIESDHKLGVLTYSSSVCDGQLEILELCGLVQKPQLHINTAKEVIWVEEIAVQHFESQCVCLWTLQTLQCELLVPVRGRFSVVDNTGPMFPAYFLTRIVEDLERYVRIRASTEGTISISHMTCSLHPHSQGVVVYTTMTLLLGHHHLIQLLLGKLVTASTHVQLVQDGIHLDIARRLGHILIR